MKLSLPDQQHLPLVVEPDGRERSADLLHELLSENRDWLIGRLHESGALLFRGFPRSMVPDFARFARTFAGRELADYTGGASPRTSLGHGVYTSTEYPSAISLSMHNELSYTFRWPQFLFFYCETPPATGGETPIADSRTVLRSLDRDLVERFRARKVMYVRRLEDDPDSEYSWQSAFETSDRAEVERFCAGGRVGFSWDSDGGLRLTEIRPATAVHPVTSDEVWFNQAEGFHPSILGDDEYSAVLAAGTSDKLRLNAFFGDGGEFDLADLEHVRAVTRANMVPVRWRAGDVLVLDNVLACHGRMPFTGPRRVLVAMA